MESSKPKKRKQPERDEQEILVQWMRLQFPKELLVQIPNGLVRGCVQARTSWKSGLVPGFPDLFLFTPRAEFHGLAIELKRPNKRGEPKGIVTDRQAEIIAYLNSRGYLAIVAFGFMDAKKAIQNYLGLKNG